MLERSSSLCVLVLILLSSSCTEAIVKGSSGGSKSAGATAVASSSRTSVYGRSYGSSTGTRLATVSILTYLVIFDGAWYPSMRFNYNNSYYDECALRNITALRQNKTDSAIDLATVNALPQLIPDSATTSDILTFNQSLYTVSNGLIVDPAYCNYTIPGSAGPRLRGCVGWALGLALLAAAYLGAGNRRGWL